MTWDRGATTTSQGQPGARGVTLVEVLIVVTLIGLLAGVTFPSISTALESIRLASAADQVVNFLNLATSHAERFEEAVLLEVVPNQGRLRLTGAQSGWQQELVLPASVHIRQVLPLLEGVEPAASREFLIFPGGPPPALGLELVNDRRARRRIELDPVTGLAVEEEERRQG